MTKSKTFWVVAALLSLTVMAFSGYSVYERLSLHFSGDAPEVKPAPVPPLPDGAEEETAESADGKDSAAEGEKKPAEQEKTKATRTPFEYKNSRAKTVLIAGSFTSWKEVKMTKKDGVWKAEIYILPGTYPYHFLVDGVKKTDPDKPSAPTGDSLLTVPY